ncbi:MAG: PTS sugar transporter subunit IIA [Elusimicrobiota bacterium]|jgi:mannitol/fructose-specific phosphotransferase system IIA component (Ntr-type)
MKSLLNALKDGRLVELPDNDKEKSLRYLAHLIEAVPELGGNLSLDEDVMARENSANTGIGLGVACPHVRAAGNGELLCAVGWSPSGIDYGSKDGKKVHLVVMYYIPDSDKNTYLKEISALASAIKKEGSIQSIAKAEDIASVREELLNWVSAAIDAGIPETKARMVRLEARQAAVAVGADVSASPSALSIIPVTIVTLPGQPPIILCQDTALASDLEKQENLELLIRQRGQFSHGSYQLVFRSSLPYTQGRALSEFLAVKKTS